jgi:hypothetical protein
LGAQNGLDAVRKTKAKYWIGTHDEVKKGGGFVAWVLKRRIWGVEDVIKGNGEKAEMGVRYVALGSGESLNLT